MDAVTRRSLGGPADRARVGSVTSASAARLANRAIALAFWVVLPVLCVMMLVLGTHNLSKHLNNVPAGTMGTYRVTSHSCSGDVCVTGGTFASADGRLVAKNLLGVYSWQDGEVHERFMTSPRST